jgi:hypothetical protein
MRGSFKVTDVGGVAWAAVAALYRQNPAASARTLVRVKGVFMVILRESVGAVAGAARITPDSTSAG